MIHTEPARQELAAILKPGDTVYTILRSVSRSGMSRRISLLTSDQRRLDWLIERAGWGKGRQNKPGLVAGGCGMDMGHHLVYCLSSRLWPNGFECLGEGCPSSDHSNGDRDYGPHHHESGGYALRHSWL